MAQASVAAIKKQIQNEQAATAAAPAATNKTTTTMTKNIANASQAGGGGATSILNKTGEVAKTLVNKTTGVLSNITKNLVGGK